MKCVGPTWITRQSHNKHVSSCYRSFFYSTESRQRPYVGYSTGSRQRPYVGYSTEHTAQGLGRGLTWGTTQSIQHRVQAEALRGVQHRAQEADTYSWVLPSKWWGEQVIISHLSHSMNHRTLDIIILGMASFLYMPTLHPGAHLWGHEAPGCLACLQVENT